MLDTRMGFPRPSLNVMIDYFLILVYNVKKDVKLTLDAKFFDCLALKLCDVINDLLPEWACLTLQLFKRNVQMI